MASDTKHHETHEPRHPDQPPPAPALSAQDKAAADKAAAETKEAMAAASIGAQIILDYNSDAAVGARGGAAGTVEENTTIRDANLVALGLDPLNCSGPPPSPEQLAARREREAGQAKEAETAPPPLARATRMSSLAAGIAPDLPPPAPEGGAAPSNVDVPFRGAGRRTA